MKKLWNIMIFYSHIESYKHLNRNHMKDRKGKCFLDTILGFGTLMTPVWNRGCDNPPRQEQPWNTETALFSWMFPSPANGRRYVPRNPTGAVISFRATPGENDVASSSFLGVPVVELHL